VQTSHREVRIPELHFIPPPLLSSDVTLSIDGVHQHAVFPPLYLINPSTRGRSQAAPSASLLRSPRAYETFPVAHPTLPIAPQRKKRCRMPQIFIPPSRNFPSHYLSAYRTSGNSCSRLFVVA